MTVTPGRGLGGGSSNQRTVMRHERRRAASRCVSLSTRALSERVPMLPLHQQFELFDPLFELGEFP
jgi:hypothetical protein